MAAILLVLFIGFTAYGTSVKYNINKIEANIEELDKEINSISLKIIENTSTQTIESKAINDLGMEYPSSSQYVYIGEDDQEKSK